MKMSEKKIVSVKEGKVRGIRTRSKYSGVEFYSFYGVPYGQPPINTLRFQVMHISYVHKNMKINREHVYFFKLNTCDIC